MKSPKQQLEIKVREMIQLANKELVMLQKQPSNAQGKIAFVACSEAMGSLKVYHSVLAALPKNQFNLKPIYNEFMIMVNHLNTVDLAHEFELQSMKTLLDDV